MNSSLNSGVFLFRSWNGALLTSRQLAAFYRSCKSLTKATGPGGFCPDVLGFLTKSRLHRWFTAAQLFRGRCTLRAKDEDERSKPGRQSPGRHDRAAKDLGIAVPALAASA